MGLQRTLDIVILSILEVLLVSFDVYLYLSRYEGELILYFPDEIFDVVLVDFLIVLDDFDLIAGRGPTHNNAQTHIRAVR